MSEGQQAAFFDFDGLLYQKESRWKIIHPELGVIGERLPWTEGSKQFQEILKKNPSAQLTDYFIPDEFSLPVHPGHLELKNKTPYSVLIRTAQEHKLRRRALKLMTKFAWPGLVSLTDRIYETQQDFRVHENPFKDAGVLSLDGNLMKDEAFARLILLRNSLKRLDGTTGYHKIFYYYTDPAMEPVLQEFMEYESSQLLDGRSALIASLIVRLEH